VPVALRCETGRGRSYATGLRADARRLMALVGLAACELSIVIADDRFVHVLNREFRGKDKPTDVLSFSQLEQAQEADGVRAKTGPHEVRVGTEAHDLHAEAGAHDVRATASRGGQHRAVSPRGADPEPESGGQRRGRSLATSPPGAPPRRAPAVLLAPAGAALGDVVISVDTARRQARRLGVAPATRMRTLLVHGLLHLLGYDHERSPADARRMFARERELSAALRRTKPRARRTPAPSARSRRGGAKLK
jgi:ssRNA-specific RNase YbeY (16S rRNA maturation enzyme)